MSIEPDRDQVFQYATYAILGLTLFTCACYGLIFLNPAINPIRSWRPPVSRQELAYQQLPPTWSPTPTVTSTPTETPTYTPTDTPTYTPTYTPTNTPPATNTPTYTATPTATNTRPATLTPRPIVRPTQPPEPTDTPAPTVNPYPWSFANMSCQHSGGLYIIIRAYENKNDPSSNTNGIRTRVSLSPDGSSIGDVTTNVGNATYVISPDGAPPRTGTFYAWIIDEQGGRISDISPAIFLNGKKDKFADSCWQAFVNFVGN